MRGEAGRRHGYMLKSLYIKHFAIIDDLHIDFSSGLTILSGETGAGKSIIVNAVNLLLGSRASGKMVRTGESSAELEAVFHVEAGSPAAMAAAAQCGDVTGELRVVRVISASDRHRITINGKPATIGRLSKITQHLASISGQHAHQRLLKEEAHLTLLDRYGGFLDQKDALGELVRTIQGEISHLADLRRRQDRQDEHASLLEFQMGEIDAAAVDGIHEDRDLEQQRDRMRNAEFLYQTVYGSIEALYSADGAVAERLHGLLADLEKAAAIDAALETETEALRETIPALEETAANLRAYLNRLDVDARELERVEDRIDELNRLKKKYGGSLEAVLAYRASIDGELEGIRNLEARMDTVRARLDDLSREAHRTAAELSSQRREAARDLAGRIVGELADLDMEGADVDLVMESVPSPPDGSTYLRDGKRYLTETGYDRAAIYLSANAGEALKPMASVASGGELSRLVLGLKAILARTDAIETVVFDEVDAGIGGKVAERVGRKLRMLAGHHQVVCITHLPQIAKFGDHHYHISKKTDRGRTATRIRHLDPADRVGEIARMLSGADITETTRQHAAEMLRQAGHPPDG